MKLVAVGSGQALALGRRRDADVLLVHAPDAEALFMEEGAGRRRLPVMRNDFVVAGPPSDPAGVRGVAGAASALAAIAARGARFISRGDDSGTHQLEQRLWRAAGTDSARLRLVVTHAGQGMAETLLIASERGAYTLTDRATFVMLDAALDLDVLVAGDPALENTYSVITVAGAPNASGADVFADWVRGPEAARIIRGFGASPDGRPLFEPVPVR